MDVFNHLPLSSIRSANPIRNINSSSLSSMGRKQKPVNEPTRYEKNRAAFVKIEYYWHTVKHCQYLRELSMDAKIEFERIYREELDPNWLPNRYCKGCYFKAVEDLIYHFSL